MTAACIMAAFAGFFIFMAAVYVDGFREKKR